jgi:hypothetical protein
MTSTAIESDHVNGNTGFRDNTLHFVASALRDHGIRQWFADRVLATDALPGYTHACKPIILIQHLDATSGLPTTREELCSRAQVAIAGNEMWRSHWNTNEIVRTLWDASAVMAIDPTATRNWLRGLITQHMIRPRMWEDLPDDELAYIQQSQIIADAYRAIDDLSRPATRDPHAYRTYTWAQMQSADWHIEYFVEGLLAKGMPMVIAGKSKTLKTSLLLAISWALATGTDVLGRRVPAPKKVLMLSGESGMPVIRETIGRIQAAVGGDPEDRLVISPDIPQLAVPRSLEMLQRMFDREQPDVFPLDPMYMVMPGDDAGNVQVQGERLRKLSTICEERGITWIPAHHTKKGTGGKELEPPTLEDIAWAGYAEFAAQWMLVGRYAPYVDGSGHHQLWLRLGGRDGHESLQGLDVYERPTERLASHTQRIWRTELCDAEQVYQRQRSNTSCNSQTARKAQQAADRLRSDQDLVRRALMTCTEPRSVPELLDLVNMPLLASNQPTITRDRCKAACKSMAATTELTETDATRGGNATKAYRFTLQLAGAAPMQVAG